MKKKNCDFCGKKATNHIWLEKTLNLAYCSEDECKRKMHCILSTLIPNNLYDVELKVVRKANEKNNN